MAQVSKTELPKEIRQEIDLQFLRVFSDKRAGKSALIELLTDIERLMLAKRLATIFMLIDEHSYYRIQQTLGISISTSKRLHSFLIGGAFEYLERIITDKRKREEIDKNIARVLRLGMPPNAYVIKKRRNR